MSAGVTPAIRDTLARAAQGAPGLELLLLYGSRARGDAHAGSDWDFGYLADPPFDVAGLLAALVERLGSDRIDLVDLSRAGGLLRFRAARDGDTIFERRPGLGDEFRLAAAAFWCDAAPVLERGYAQVLAELDR